MLNNKCITASNTRRHDRIERLIQQARLYVRFGTDGEWHSRFPDVVGGAPVAFQSSAHPAEAIRVMLTLRSHLRLSPTDAADATMALAHAPEAPPFTD